MSPEEFVQLMHAIPGAIDAEDMSAEKGEIGDSFRESQKGNFERESDQFGTPWAPRKHEYDHPPLRDTLAMFDAATERGAFGNIHDEGDGYLVLGIDGKAILYSSIHNNGEGMVKRQFFYLRAKDRTKFGAPLRKVLLRVLEKQKQSIGA